MGLQVSGVVGVGRGPFSLSVPRGQCVLLSGPSGSGKSLLLRMIADLDPNEGDVLLDGLSRQDVSAPEWRRRVVYVPAESGWWEDEVGAHMADVEAARALLAPMCLPPAILSSPVSRVSTGEKQRLALIRALVRKPDMLLLDEPTSGLDQASTRAVEAVLRQRLEAGAGVLMVSHHEEQAARMGNAHYRMSPDGLEAVR
ncbi:ABC transporter ATP-binding protein [Cupriavidus plantarum]|uniref:ABC transporter ATP-binding protein n=1 Tax=Cupriavidus plantarum TaxID=942865 RepID=UPI000E273276|nr:ABC transporter ATP-binding protein [Cupriavidus plantarum]REE89196.1 ABC-type iron transport system FetAB ATPase subunit [Cupriavidus plantarum]